jgi:WD40 repeat protein
MGSTLSESGRAYWQSVARIGIQVAEALAHAASLGITHRDIKPSNLLLDAQGTVWVTDFGLAKAEMDGENLTHTGDIVGTLRYMAPERFQGQSDVRSDLCSLGLTLYELLTLRPAYDEADRNKLLQQVMHEEPTRPRKVNPAVPRDLETIVLKAIDRDPARRYQTPAAMADDLKRFVEDRPIRARRVGLRERAWRWCRRNPALASATGLAATALVAVAALAILFALHQSRAAEDLRGEQKQTQAALDQSQLLAAALALEKGQLLWKQGDADQALLWMARSLRMAPEGAGPLKAVIRTNLGAWRGQVNPLRMVLPHEGWVGAVAFTSDGKTLLTASGAEHQTGSIRRWDATNGQPRGDPLAIGRDGAAMEVLVFSPDRSSLLIGYGDGVARLINVADGETLWQSPSQGGSITRAAFSPDGKRVLLAWGDSRNWLKMKKGSVQLWDAATGKPIGPILKEPLPVFAAAFHPDGKTFVTVGGSWINRWDKSVARFWDTEGKEIRRPLEFPCSVLTVAYSPDGKKLLAGHWDYAARLWDLASDQPLLTIPHEAPVSAVAFRPHADGKTILTTSFDGTARLWETDKGEPLGPRLSHQDLLIGAAFSPNGKTFLTGGVDRTARLWEVAVSSPARPRGGDAEMFFPLAFSLDRRIILTRRAVNTVQLRDVVAGQWLGKPLRHEGPVGAGAFSRDRKRAVTIEKDYTAWLWDPETGERIRELPHPDLAYVVAFSPDGKTVVTGHNSKALHWNATTGEPIGELSHRPVGPVLGVAFSPDSKTILTGAVDGVARLWDAATGKPIRELAHPSAVLAVAFSLDGKAILTGGTDRTARLWDAATGKLLGPPLVHEGAVYALAFSHDGKVLATGSRDRTAQLWDAVTGRRLGPPLLHPEPVLHIAFGPDDKTVWTGVGVRRNIGADNVAYVWPVPAPVAGAADQIERWVQMMTGMELDANGGVRVLDAAAWLERRQQLMDSGFQGP